MKISDVKEQFSNDEKVLESVFRIEAIYNKYKVYIFAFLILCVVGFVGYKGYGFYAESQAQKTTKIFNSLLSDMNNSELLSKLRVQNNDLYEFVALFNALQNGDVDSLKTLNSSKDGFISSYSKYMGDSYSKTPLSVGEYSDFAKVQEALILIKSGDIKKARVKLNEISATSPLSNISSVMKHYGLNN